MCILSRIMFRSLITFVLFICLCSSVLADVSVRGYYRKDGTYVRPHMRSNPDGNFYNNWSTVGNVNPYTGKPGTKTSPNYSSNYNYEQSKNYSYQSQNYNRVPSGSVFQNFDTNKKVSSAKSTRTTLYSDSNKVNVNGVNWFLLGKNVSDATYIGQTEKEYYGDGLPVVSLMYTGVMKRNGRLTWLGKRFIKVKVNCSSNNIAPIADAIVNSSGVVVRNKVLREDDELTWFLISEMFNQSKFYSLSGVC